MTRYLVITAAIVMQMCLGGIYAWSAFVPELREAYGYSAAQTQLVFGTSFLVFTISGVFTGRGQDLRGPRPFGVASGVFLAAGYLVASVSGGSFLLLWLGIGVLGGLGIGCGYVCTIATAVKWFPSRKGLVSGLAVAGYGAGAIVLANGAELLFERGWQVLEVFRAVGLVYGPVVLLAGLCLIVPASDGAAFPLTLRRRELLRDRRFWALCAAMFCGTLPGLAISGSLKPIGLFLGLTAPIAVQAISFFAIGSGTGRILWGLAGDQLGGRRMALLALALIALSPLLLFLAGLADPEGYAFLGAALFGGFCYGSSFALYPAQVADIYGARVVGTVYTLVMLAHGLAAEVGPGVCGLLFDETGSFLSAMVLATVLAAAGFVLYGTLSARRR
ncbi:MAG: MFS transporter [Planctomycetota bacterium]